MKSGGEKRAEMINNTIKHTFLKKVKYFKPHKMVTLLSLMIKFDGFCFKDTLFIRCILLDFKSIFINKKIETKKRETVNIIINILLDQFKYEAIL